MVYVMSDIHGNMKNFRSIMKQIKLQPEDQLYILGDVIDRYPDGIKILRQIMKMPNAHMLRGNHEHMMSEALTNPTQQYDSSWEQGCTSYPMRLWYHNGGKVTYDRFKYVRKDTRKDVLDYIASLPFNLDVEVNGVKYKLVHASPLENYESYRPFYSSPEEFAVWERWSERDCVPEGYILIFGHTPTIYFHEKNPLKIWYGDEAIGIDCGSGYSDGYVEKGRLACLRLDDMKEFYSK